MLRNPATRSAIHACALFLGLAGCNATPPPLYGDQPVKHEEGPAPTPPDMAMVKYPEGPYGNQEGETLADINFAGYRMSPGNQDPEKLMWDETIKLGEFHANPACKCLLVTWGATWCGACQQEQPALVADIQKDPSFCVINILQEGPKNGTLATQSDVKEWASHFQQNFPVVIGTKQTQSLWNGWAMNGVIGLPFNFIVQPRTMKVLGNVQGFSPTIHDEAMALCAP